ncbi:MAG: hypothetical protein N2050_07115 [Flavobacteriales bacterium]|nr:hypothetical protein [Flavobacteriales bacterium]MCX7650305.1 hypothetical protein [Flavobacteriales bacterium]MDW8431939.1 hypothetical protein [Flavobacteriales bacterium]
MAVSLASVTGALLYIFFFLSDDIKAQALSLISRTVRTEVSLSEPVLDIFSGFPYVVLELNDVRCRGLNLPGKSGDLFQARRVQLKFSVWDFFLGQINFKRIRMEDGYFHLIRHESGGANWAVFNTDILSAESAGRALFSIDRIDIRNMALRLEDAYLHNRAVLRLKSLELAGNFQATEPDVVLESEVRLDSMLLANGLNPTPADYSLLASLQAQPNQKMYWLRSCEVRSGNEMQLRLNGRVEAKGSEGFETSAEGFLDLRRQTRLEGYLPLKEASWSEGFSLQGDLQARFNIQGVVGPSKSPLVSVWFRLAHGQLGRHAPASDNVLYCVASGRGRFESGYWRLDIPLLGISSEQGTRLSGSFRMEDGQSRKKALSLKGKFSLEDLGWLLKFPENRRPSGGLEGSLSLRVGENGKFIPEARVYGQNIVFPLGHEGDTLVMGKVEIRSSSSQAIFEVEQGRLMGQDFYARFHFPINPSENLFEKAETSVLEFDRFNLADIKPGFWTQPFLGPWTGLEVLMALPPGCRISSEILTYENFTVQGVEARKCTSTHKRNTLLTGFGKFCDAGAAFKLEFLSTAGKLHLVATAVTEDMRSVCLLKPFAENVRSFSYPDLLSDNCRLALLCQWYLPPQRPPAFRWKTRLVAGPGTLSGSDWQQELVSMTGWPEGRKITFQNLTYEALGDSGSVFQARAELRLKNSVARLLHGSYYDYCELEGGDNYLGKIRSYLEFNVSESLWREESGHLLLAFPKGPHAQVPAFGALRQEWNKQGEEFVELDKNLRLELLEFASCDTLNSHGSQKGKKAH